MRYEPVIRPPESSLIKAGRVILKPNEEIGKHKTDYKEELIIVLRGIATIVISDKECIVNTHETFFIPINVVHNVLNKHDHNLEYVYVCSLNKPGAENNKCSAHNHSEQEQVNNLS